MQEEALALLAATAPSLSATTPTSDYSRVIIAIVLIVKLDCMKRRVMMRTTYNAEPKLVKLTSNPGVTQSYTIEDSYRYFDLLVVGGGGAGGTNSGGGGGSGAIVYVKNFNIKKLWSKSVTYKIANQVTTDNNGDYSLFSFDGVQIRCNGGNKGSINGIERTQGHGATLPDLFDTLSPYTDNPESNIAICSNGGGSGGSFVNQYGYAGGSGASMSSAGNRNSGMNAGANVANSDGSGGFNGGASQGYSGGVGRKLNNVIIPIVSVFGGGGRGGAATKGLGSNGSGAGGGAAAYGSGGNGGAAGSGTNGTNGGYGSGGGGGGGLSHKGGNGGQGIICLYYHN